MTSNIRSAIAVLAVGFAAECHADCESLATPRSFPDTTISSAKTIAADASRKLPAFCEVTGVITPVPGSRIGVVASVRAAYQGVKTADGMVAAYPLTRGGEGAWARFTIDPERAPGAPAVPPTDGGLGGLRTVMFGDPNYDLSRFDVERDMKKLRTSAFADLFEADNPDLSAYLKNGGNKGTGNPNEAANFDCR